MKTNIKQLTIFNVNEYLMYIINVCFNVQGVVALVGRFATFAPVRFSEAKFYLYHSTRG